MNPDILRGLLIDELGRVRADALLERCQLMSAMTQSRAEAEAQRVRIRELEAEANQRATEAAKVAEPEGSWPTDSAAEIDPRRAPQAGVTAR